MKRILMFAAVGLVAMAVGGGQADGRGFGGFRGGGGWGGGGFSHSSSFSASHSESFGRTGFDSFGGSRSSSFSGSRSTSAGGWTHSGEASGSRSGGFEAGGGRAAGGSSYDRSYTGSRGGSYSAAGERGIAAGPRGVAGGSSRDVTATGPQGRTYSSDTDRGFAAGQRGAVAGGSRDVNATGLGGRSISSSAERGAAVGPYGRYVGGGTRTATASGARGTATADWQSAFAGRGHMSTDLGLSHYSSFGAAGVRHSTTYWSHGYTTAHASTVRTNFGYYGAFRPDWYRRYPNCWTAAGWAAGAAWTAASWASIAAFCSVPAAPVNYDYGDTVVIQGDTVYQNGQPSGSATDYATQATALADKGQQADPPPDAEWKPLGVYALTQGDEQQSDYVFQLAVNQAGVIRGNYYDGLTDTTTPVYGSVDPKSQRAAWTIGKKSDRVFEAGISNLTGDQCPVLVHAGKDRTQQWMLVRVQQPVAGQ